MIGFIVLAFFSGLFIGAGVGILLAAKARPAPDVTWSGPLPSTEHGGLHIGHIAEA